MKKQNTITILTGIVLCASLLFMGCNNITQPSPGAAGPGMGNLTIHFFAGKAALSPSQMDFDFYKFTFYRNGELIDSGVKGKTDSFTFTLETGPGYTLEVKAYKGEVDDANLAAIGEYGPFTVSASTSITVQLNGFLSEGPKGYFSYAIEYPPDAIIEELTLRIDNTESLDLLGLLYEAPDGAVTDVVELAAGKYFFILRLSRDDGRERTGYANGVEIMSGHTTFYGTDTEPKIFGVDDFDVVYEPPVDPGVRIWEWRDFNVEGMSHYYNNDRATNGRIGIPWGPQLGEWDWELDGNYDPSHAVGYQYDSFTDGNGGTWSDVLKLVPPAYNNPLHFRQNDPMYSGYQTYTMTLTYKLEEAGTYKLSMYYQVEESNEAVSVYWQNSGGINKDVPETSEFRAWRNIAGNNGYWVPRGTPQYFEGTFDVLANEEIGMLARSMSNGGGLRDATVYILDLKVERILPPEPPELVYVRNWEEFEEVFDVPGVPEKFDNHGQYYYGSDADYSFVDYEGYENVLKLEPWKAVPGDAEAIQNVGLAMRYDVPESGWYTFTMEVWIDPTALGVPKFVWFRTREWGYIIQEDLHTGGWYSYTGSMYLNAGETTGFYTHYYGSTASFMDTSIYFRSFKLECDALDDPIVDIECVPITTPPPPTEEQTITLEWDNGSLITLQAETTIQPGGSVTITAPDGLPKYEWRLGAGVVGTGKTYTFTSPGNDTGKTYKVIFSAGSAGGATIDITVAE